MRSDSSAPTIHHRRVILAAPVVVAALFVGCSDSSDGSSATAQDLTLTDAGPGLASAVVTCSSLVATQGSLGGSTTNACTGALANVGGAVVSWQPHTPPTSAVATYASPFSAADVTKLELLVQFIGDDKTEPLWYWSALNKNTNQYDVIGDNSWAGNWVSTAHTFTIANPASYVDASGNVRIRFTSNTSKNDAELDRMVLRVTGAYGGDAGATDTGSPDTGTADTGAADTSAADTGTADTGMGDTGIGDTGIGDTGSGDTSSGGDGGGPNVDLFDPDLLPTFELTLDAAAVAVFSSTAEADQKTWVHGTFKYGSTVINDVGVRRKGTSTFRAMPQKVALKVKFDKYVKGQTFMGLTDLTLNNQTSDPTYLTERLAYHVFRSAGLPAQRANACRVFINGEDYGLHANVETPNDQFMSRVFGANANTLYEQAWGSEWTPGCEDGFDVQEGDDSKADLTQLFQTVAAARASSLLADVSSHLDTTEFLDHCAAEAAVGDYDGYAYAIWGSGNYFLAGGKNGVFSIVPWSLDLTFSNRERVVNANRPQPADPVDGGKTLLMRCKANASCWSTYKQRVQAMLVKYESLGLVNLARKWNAQIDALARTDPKSEYSVSDYQSETTKLYSWLSARPGVVRKQLGLPTP